MAGTTTNMGIPYPTSTDLVKDGATAMQSLAEEVDTKSGMVLVKSQTVGTGVTSVTVSNCFSATFANYRILMHGGTGTAAFLEVQLRLGASAASYYSALVYGTFAGAAPATAGNSNQAQFAYAGSIGTQESHVDVTLYGPNLTKYTGLVAPHVQFTSAGAAGIVTGYHSVRTAYTGFELRLPAGTMTGGIIRVYGYNLG